MTNVLSQPLLQPTDNGLYCAAGDFYIDPQRRVERAVITHAHADHARPGCGSYLTSVTGAPLLCLRLGQRASIQSAAFGESLHFSDVTLSLHPAGHILGSAQVRVEQRGEIWVVSGDYKNEPDSTAEHFEPIRCQTFITECTFGREFYRWRPQAEVFDEINAWWRENAAKKVVSVLCAYSLGKAQRVLAGVDAQISPIVIHPNAAAFLPAYESAGVKFPTLETKVSTGALVIASSINVAVRDLTGDASIATAFASGWMLRPDATRQYGVRRGFALSDHADWIGLTETIRATGAERIGVTHGDPRELLRWLRGEGLDGWSVAPRKITGQMEFDLP